MPCFFALTLLCEPACLRRTFPPCLSPACTPPCRIRDSVPAGAEKVWRPAFFLAPPFSLSVSLSYENLVGSRPRTLPCAWTLFGGLQGQRVPYQFQGLGDQQETVASQGFQGLLGLRGLLLLFGVCDGTSQQASAERSRRRSEVEKGPPGRRTDRGRSCPATFQMGRSRKHNQEK